MPIGQLPGAQPIVRSVRHSASQRFESDSFSQAQFLLPRTLTSFIAVYPAVIGNTAFGCMVAVPLAKKGRLILLFSIHDQLEAASSCVGENQHCFLFPLCHVSTNARFCEPLRVFSEPVIPERV